MEENLNYRKNSIYSRIELAKKSKYEEVLAKLAKSWNWEVRLAVAENDATADETLNRLANDFCLSVNKAARKNLKKRFKAK